MIIAAYHQTILEMISKGISVRRISRALKVSRNTVRHIWLISTEKTVCKIKEQRSGIT